MLSPNTFATVTSAWATAAQKTTAIVIRMHLRFIELSFQLDHTSVGSYKCHTLHCLTEDYRHFHENRRFMTA
jgi:hypothetical protein